MFIKVNTIRMFLVFARFKSDADRWNIPISTSVFILSYTSLNKLKKLLLINL